MIQLDSLIERICIAIHLGTDEVKPITFLKISSLVKAKADEWFQVSVASISRRNSFLLDEWLQKLSGIATSWPIEPAAS